MASCGSEEDDVDLETPTGSKQQNKGKRKEVESETDDDDVEIPPSGQQKKKGKKKKTEGDSGSKSGSGSKRSWVWEHFIPKKEDPDIGNCKHCTKEMVIATRSGTSSLSKHLLFACNAFKLWSAANNYTKGKTQTTLPNSGEMKLCKVSDKVVREASNEMLVLAELPLAFIESLAWKHFCSKADLCKPHSRRTAARDIVEMFVTKKAAMKKILGDNTQRLSLTTYIWVCQPTGASYMVITAHFIDVWWNLKKLIIGFKNVYDHKGSTICKVLVDCLAEWDIKKIFSITVDNATANTTALTEFQEEFQQLNGDEALVLNGVYLHLRCATHIINLVVKEGLLEISDSVNAIRNGIYFVRSSTSRLKSFEGCVESGRVQRGSLPLDVKTRWNSTYLMLEQALKFRAAFDKMAGNDLPYYAYFKDIVGPPSRADWEAADRLVQFLVIFYRATLVLSASNTPCSHKLYHAIVTLTKNITRLHNTAGSDEALRDKAMSMFMKLDKYWNPFDKKVEMNKLVMVAAVFDPCKKMKFVQGCFDNLYGKDSAKAVALSAEVKDILRNLFDEYKMIANKARDESVTNSGAHSNGGYSQSQDQFVDEVSERTVFGNGIQYESMNDLYNELVQESGFSEKADELELYLKENVENPHVVCGTEYDVLSFWRVNSPKFPVLSQVAKDILAMQVSSVAAESAFSTSGRVLDPTRSCLTHYMIEVLMCTEQWLKCEIKVNDRGVTRKEQLLADVEMQDELMREFEPEFNSSRI